MSCGLCVYIWEQRKGEEVLICVFAFAKGDVVVAEKIKHAKVGEIMDLHEVRVRVRG